MLTWIKWQSARIVLYYIEPVRWRAFVMRHVKGTGQRASNETSAGREEH